MYDKSTNNNIFIEGVKASIWHSQRNDWANNPPTDLTDIAFQAESLLTIQKILKCNPKTNTRVTSRQDCKTRKIRTAEMSRIA